MTANEAGRREARCRAVEAAVADIRAIERTTG